METKNDPPTGAADTRPLVTVIVVNWNGETLLPDCLDALAKQDLPEGQMQVWVVDNASTDGSVTLLERDYPWVRLLRNGRNDGFAGGNNLALREARTPYVALLNSDARPATDWVRNLIAPLQEADSREADSQEADRQGGGRRTGAEQATRRMGATTSKLLFLPKFVPVQIDTEGFVPGGLDPRSLGVRIYTVTVDGRDVTEEILWDRVAYGPEGTGKARFRWVRPSGDLLVPLEPDGRATLRVTLTLAAERAKPVTITWPGGGSATVEAMPEPGAVDVEIPVTPTLLSDGGLIDVLNNTGGIVFSDGYGADRAYQEVDTGQFEAAEDVFGVCGAACAFRAEALAATGVFDDDFFMYYEDTDLSWRLRALGWDIRYEPGAVVRHIHAASSTEWSPLFTFHVDRNRLLMLVKNASAPLALRECLRYPLTTASLAARAVAQARHTRSRPPLRPTLLRLKVSASFLRLLPVMLARRARIARGARVGRGQLERWLIAR
jgi:GT2 family glycosyltransferase